MKTNRTLRSISVKRRPQAPTASDTSLILQSLPDDLCSSLIFKKPKNYLALRTSFTYKEQLLVLENEQIEFKGYSFPLSSSLSDKITQTINAFLNNKGGRLYIGINNDSIVQGIELTYTKMDELKLSILNQLSSFEPPVRMGDRVSVHFLPVKNETGFAMPGLFVVKILVKPGNPRILYSVEPRSSRCYIRLDGQNIYLTYKEVMDEIIKRYNCKEQLDDSGFNDPEPDEPFIVGKIEKSNFPIKNTNPVPLTVVKKGQGNERSQTPQPQSSPQTSKIFNSSPIPQQVIAETQQLITNQGVKQMTRLFYIFPKRASEYADSDHMRQVIDKNQKEIIVEQCYLLPAQPQYPDTRKGLLVFISSESAKNFCNWILEKKQTESSLYHVYVH